MTKKETSFPFPISSFRGKVFYTVLGLLGTGVVSWFTLFADKNYFTQEEGKEVQSIIHDIKHDYYSKEDAAVLEDRVLILENNEMHQTKQLDRIVLILER